MQRNEAVFLQGSVLIKWAKVHEALEEKLQ